MQNYSPPGSPSHTSSQSYLQSPSPPGRGSFSRSNVRKVRVISMLVGTTMMKEHSRLWGYLSGKPGDSMKPEGLVKLREQSEPGETIQQQKGRDIEIIQWLVTALKPQTVWITLIISLQYIITQEKSCPWYWPLQTMHAPHRTSTPTWLVLKSGECIVPHQKLLRNLPRTWQSS